jgi:hypothetical protein
MMDEEILCLISEKASIMKLRFKESEKRSF